MIHRIGKGLSFDVLDSSVLVLPLLDFFSMTIHVMTRATRRSIPTITPPTAPPTAVALSLKLDEFEVEL